MKSSVVIPYRRSYSEELKYMLRSLKNIPHGDVFIIGDDPKLNVNYIRYFQTMDVAQNTLGILDKAVENPDITEDFIWMHDDHFILYPVQKIPIKHRGTYEEVIEHYAGRINYYVNRMIETQKVLKENGVENPLCYELHIPFVINKTKWKNIRHLIQPQHNKLSMYGNLNHIGGDKMKDVKVRTKDVVPTSNFVSTFDGTFGTNTLGKMIREKFPDKSRYEP